MKIFLIILLCTVAGLSLAVSSSRSHGAAPEACMPLPTPTPYVVPGTEWRGHVVTAKRGYEFVQRDVGVGVVNTRTNAFMGSYTCPCNSSDPNRKCELIFSPTYLTCKGGSCSGNAACIFVGAPLVKRQ